MEIKISIKDGDKSTSFKFAGDPLEVVDSVLTKVEMLWDQVFPNKDGDSWQPFVKRVV